MSTSIDQTPDQLQRDAVTYFRSMELPAHIVLEVWSTDEDTGTICLDPRCVKVGYVHISNQSYCVGHASLVLMGMPETSRRHISVDVARPILIPRAFAQQPELAEMTIAFLQFVVRQKGSTITVDMARRANGLVSLLTRSE